MYITYLQTNNKYSKWYKNIIEEAIARKWTEKDKKQLREMKIYTDRHHIIPKSFYKSKNRTGWLDGDPNVKENLVYLTLREHFLVHWLLCYCYNNTLATEKMIAAFNKLCIGNNNKTSIYYQYARKMFSQYISVKMTGNKNSLGKKLSREQIERGAEKRRGQKRSIETRLKQSMSAKRYIKSEEHRNKIAYTQSKNYKRTNLSTGEIEYFKGLRKHFREKYNLNTTLTIPKTYKGWYYEYA